MGRNKDIRSESDDISGKVVITMAKKHAGIGIAAIAAGAGAATYMKKKSQKKQKKAQMDARYQDYRNTERGKQVKNKKGIYYSNGNYEAFARPEKPRALKNIGFVNFIFKGIRNPPVSNQVLVDFLNSV